MTRTQKLKNLQKINCITTLSEKFRTATLVIVRCDEGAAEHEKQAQIKLLTIRATVKGATKFVIGRVYSESGNVRAFHVFLDISVEDGEKICKRWKLGPHEVHTVDMGQIETFQTELFVDNPIPRRAVLYRPNMP